MKVTKKQLCRILEPSIATKKRTTEIAKINDTCDDIFDIQFLDRLLTAHALGLTDISRISDQLYLSPQKSSEIMQIAASIERMSGFQSYRAQKFIDDPILNTVTDDLSIKSERVTKEFPYQDLLSCLEYALVDMSQDITGRGITAWIHTYHHPSSSNIAADIGELSALLEFYEQFPFPLEISILSRKIFPELEKIATCAKHKFRIVENSHRAPLANEKLMDRRYGRVQIKTHLKGKPRSGRIFHRLMFLLAIFQKHEESKSQCSKSIIIQ